MFWHRKQYEAQCTASRVSHVSKIEWRNLYIKCSPDTPTPSTANRGELHHALSDRSDLSSQLLQQRRNRSKSTAGPLVAVQEAIFSLALETLSKW